MSYGQYGYIVNHPNHNILENERILLITKLEPLICLEPSQVHQAL